MREYQPPPAMPSVSAGRIEMAERHSRDIGNQPSEIGEDIEQDEPDDELRRRDAGEGEHHDALSALAAPGGGEDARRNADQQLEEDGAGISSSVAGRRP